MLRFRLNCNICVFSIAANRRRRPHHCRVWGYYFARHFSPAAGSVSECSTVGVFIGERGQIQENPNQRTWSKSIFCRSCVVSPRPLAFVGKPFAGFAENPVAFVQPTNWMLKGDRFCGSFVTVSCNGAYLIKLSIGAFKPFATQVPVIGSAFSDTTVV